MTASARPADETPDIWIFPNRRIRWAGVEWTVVSIQYEGDAREVNLTQTNMMHHPRKTLRRVRFADLAATAKPVGL